MYLAGSAVRDVSPPTGYRLQGHDARRKRSNAIHDPLMLKALSLSDGRQRVYVITSDLVSFPQTFACEVKKAIHKELGIRPEQVMLTAAHVHTGPFMSASSPEDKQQLIPDYLSNVKNKIIAAIREATEKEEPVTLRWGRSETDIGIVNRRLPTPYGVEMLPNPDGPVDHEVLVLTALNRENLPRAILFNYACHPTTLAMDIAQISADFPGAAQSALEKKHPGATAMFINGCCGDVRPNLVENNRFKGGSFEDVERMGGVLAQSVSQTLENARPVPEGAVEGRQETVRLPLDQALLPDTPAHLEQAAARHLRQPKRDESASGAWYTPAVEPAVNAWKAEMLARLQRGEKPCATVPMDIQALIVGDVKIVGLGGEIMVEIGLRIKAAGGPGIMVGSCANGVAGYIPTAAALNEGGYEAKSFLSRKYPAPYDYSMEETLHEHVLALAMAQHGE